MLRFEMETAKSPQQFTHSQMIGEPALLWKVYNIETGKIMKAGFESEDDAKDWLEERYEDLADEYAVEEMDQDEEDDWRDANDEDNDEVVAAPAAEDEIEYGDDDEFLDDDEEDSDEESLDEVFDDDDDDEG